MKLVKGDRVLVADEDDIMVRIRGKIGDVVDVYEMGGVEVDVDGINVFFDSKSVAKSLKKQEGQG